MCGIAGIYSMGGDLPFSSSDVAEKLQRSRKSIHHRGPDGSDQFHDSKCGLAHVRLSIIDLSVNSNQPMWNDSKDICIVFNGEIYNYQQIRAHLAADGVKFRSSGDTETLLALYEKKQEACLDELDGMFSFAIYDKKRGRFFAARDRIGIKPFYYAVKDGTFLFGSEIKAILEFGIIDKKQNEMALAQYLQFMAVQTPETIYQDVKKLKPAHYLVIENGNMKISRYWDVTDAHASVNSFDEMRNELDSRLKESVKSHMVSDVKVGAFLSGGLDSSAVTALSSRLTDIPLDTFSVTFPEDDKYNEARYARQVSKHCGTRHHEFEMNTDFTTLLPDIVRHSDEPFAISSSIALYLLSRETAKSVKVVLTGDGSDEIFAGYTRHFHPRKFESVTSKIPGPVLNSINSLVNFTIHASGMNTNSHPFNRIENARRQLLSDAPHFQAEQLASFDKNDVRGLIDRDYFESKIAPVLPSSSEEIESAYASHRHFDDVNRKLYSELRTSLVDEMLTKVDKMTMAFGLEARVPFLDHCLVEFAFTIPGNYKHDGKAGKLILKKMLEPYLPNETIYRSKWGFNVPLNPWFNTKMKEFIGSYLEEGRIRKDGIFNPGSVAKLLKDHHDGKADNSNKIFQLLIWNLWTDSK